MLRHQGSKTSKPGARALTGDGAGGSPLAAVARQMSWQDPKQWITHPDQ